MVLLAAGFSTAQVDKPLLDRPEVPKFYFDALVFAGDDTTVSRLDIYVQVPYEALRFVQGQNGYDASYEETINIYDDDEKLVMEKFAVERIRRPVFSETVDPTLHNLTQRFFRLKPGTYMIAVQVRDEETQKSTRLTREVNVRPLHGSSLTISDLMLVNHLRLEGEKKSIIPNITGNVGNLPDGFYVFCEIYNRTECDSLNVSYHVQNAKSEEKLKEQFSQILVRGTNQLFVKINSTSLPMGSYSVGVQGVTCEHQAEKPLSTSLVSHTFAVRWVGIPVTVGDLDLAIEQLVYTAESKEIDEIKSGSTLEEKKKRFYEFWKKKDTNPATERNEALEEYYGRVEFSNQNFSHYREGWKSDRGMVYIMFGPPNAVDRHPFESYAKPYEVWYYHELNYRFLFVDLTGFGDYRLDPSTPLWNIKNKRQ